MPRTDTDQTFDQNGNLLSSQTVQRPTPAIDPATYQQARATLRNMSATFAPGGVPTGNPTNAQLRNWLISVTTGLRYVFNELDDE